MNDLDTTKSLVTIEEARAYVWRDENDATRDGVLVDAINLVSPAIWTHCEREFKDAGAATRTFALKVRVMNGSRVGWIDLAPYDLRSATAVKLYTDQPAASQQTLTVDEYRLRPVGGALGGTYLEIITVEPTASEEQLGFGWEATVTGNWGMSAVPNDVKLAALEWIKNIAENPGSYASVDAGGFPIVPAIDVSPAGRAGMPPSVRYRLRDYCRSIR